MGKTEKFLNDIRGLRNIDNEIKSRLLILESKVQGLISELVVVKGNKDKAEEIRKKIPELETALKTSLKILKEILEENQKGGLK